MRLAWRCTKGGGGGLSPSVRGTLAVGRKGLFLLKLRDPVIILAAALCHGLSPVVKTLVLEQGQSDNSLAEAYVVSGNAPRAPKKDPSFSNLALAQIRTPRSESTSSAMASSGKQAGLLSLATSHLTAVTWSAWSFCFVLVNGWSVMSGLSTLLMVP